MNLSIALCTYNGEKFLQDQLDSIARQTLLPDELVVCDDCSRDGTLGILDGFRGKAPFPVHVHRNERNLGSTKNFEKSISLCSGEIIALCDQDDVWKPQKLKRLVDVLQANPDAGYVFSDAELVDENLRPLAHSLWESSGFKDDVRRLFIQGEQFRCFTRKHFVTGATMAFRASIGRMALPIPAEGYWIHDGWIALVSSASGALGVPVDEALISYRQHSNQQIGASDPEGRKSLLDMYQELKTSQQPLFTAWEKHCLQILSLKRLLHQLRKSHYSASLEENIRCLQEFEKHFLTRRKILTSKSPGRYRLILSEAFSGRYARFSDSWKSVFRDIFL